MNFRLVQVLMAQEVSSMYKVDGSRGLTHRIRDSSSFYAQQRGLETPTYGSLCY